MKGCCMRARVSISAWMTRTDLLSETRAFVITLTCITVRITRYHGTTSAEKQMTRGEGYWRPRGEVVQGTTVAARFDVCKNFCVLVYFSVCLSVSFPV